MVKRYNPSARSYVNTDDYRDDFVAYNRLPDKSGYIRNN